ncbi:MAG: histidine phosphatase family protein [Nitrospiraceae bacterium]|nr:MAG: histidine phosphatase family protein [Nitrospiraceae bacterium]
MTRIYLIRHGETVDSDSRRYKGHIDVPLSERGIEQVRRLASCLTQGADRRLPVTGLNAVYSSGLSRALKSAEIIARPFGLSPVIHEGLKERSFGLWEGMSFDEIRERWPDAFASWAENPLRFSPLEGESTLDVRDRALQAFYEIARRHGEDDIAIVAHGGINRVILCEILGMPFENIFRIEQDFAALNVIELWDYPVVKQMNYVV